MNNHIEKSPDAQLTSSNQPPLPPGRNWLQIAGIILLACIVSTLIALTVVYFYLFPGPFKPVELSNKEEQVLEQKLDRLDSIQRLPTLHKYSRDYGNSRNLQPERYSKDDASREIILTEREINALLARNTDLAQKLAIDLSADLASAKFLIPLDKEFPVLGGKTLKVNAGLEMSYRNRKPIVVLRGVSLWGVPIPNAWLGNIKNVDLVEEFGGEKGFWKAFADGVEEIEVSDGLLRIKLKE